MLIKQTKTRPQEPIQFNSTKTICTFSIRPPLELQDEKYETNVIMLETLILILKLNERKNFFTICASRYWQNPEFTEKIEGL